ncbi:MAG: hypothetical protein U0411_14630 [Thermodesulfovibrionales bacterium]
MPDYRKAWGGKRMNGAAPAVLVIMAAVLVLLHRHGRQEVRRKRGAMFDACIGLFESCRLSRDGIYFPVLEGRYRGYAVRIELIADHIAVRKLPSLWLIVTLRGRVRWGGVLDFLVRPLNVEFFSPAALLDCRLPVPPGWPQDAWLRSDRPEAMPPLESVEPHIRFFEDPKAKELLVTPRGIRLVYQAKEGVRAYYTVLRQVEFAGPPLSPSLLGSLMDRAIALYEDLKQEGH